MDLIEKNVPLSSCLAPVIKILRFLLSSATPNKRNMKNEKTLCSNSSDASDV